MKIVFFGTPEFSIPALKSLNKTSNIEILAVVTQSDKPVGRKNILTSPPIKKVANELNLKVLQPKNKKELHQKLQNLASKEQIDFFVVIAYGMIFDKEILKIPKYGSINIHASLLPKYRGASPIQESLLNGDSETGVTIMKMDEKLDEGAIYLVRRVKIEEKDNLETLTKRLADLSEEIIPHVLEDIISNSLTPIPQSEKIATYCEKIKKDDGKINWNLSAKTILNKIKALNPWPSTFTDLKGKKMKILEAEIENKNSNYPPGLVYIEDKILKISTKEGILIPTKIQLEGKNEMNAKSFINGYKNLLN